MKAAFAAIVIAHALTLSAGSQGASHVAGAVRISLAGRSPCDVGPMACEPASCEGEVEGLTYRVAGPAPADGGCPNECADSYGLAKLSNDRQAIERTIETLNERQTANEMAFNEISREHERETALKLERAADERVEREAAKAEEKEAKKAEREEKERARHENRIEASEAEVNKFTGLEDAGDEDPIMKVAGVPLPTEPTAASAKEGAKEGAEEGAK